MSQRFLIPPGSPLLVASGLNRRRFLYTTALTLGAAALRAHAAAKPRLVSANGKPVIAGIGVGGKGAVDLKGLHDGGASQVVALCDVDRRTLESARAKYPGARLYTDYRVMLEKEADLDAVNVSTPDHHHYPATLLAMRKGLGVYTQKPLTHTVWEARQLTEAARRMGVVTQMGNQGHSGGGNRVLCEHLWAGLIGEVREVHCWTNRPIWPQGQARPAGSDPVPEYLDWDSWIGPAPMRPYVGPGADAKDPKKKAARGPYHPFNWRGIWDFGAGALGDMGCHVMDGACWALRLENPASVEVVDSAPRNDESAPAWSVLRYEFPARPGHDGRMLPACTLTWHDGGRKPPRQPGQGAYPFAENGTLFVGSEGRLVTETYGGSPRLLVKDKLQKPAEPKRVLERVPGDDPYLDFLRGLRGGPKPCSNFEVSGPFTEVVLLGNLALRLGKKVEWDAANLKSPNCPEAAPFIRKPYRKGWEA
ncbi:MAG: Inositol 2-dehydrogenase [Verrucomicrobiota bacterium]|jgi:predicted dehydrogenase